MLEEITIQLLINLIFLLCFAYFITMSESYSKNDKILQQQHNHAHLHTYKAPNRQKVQEKLNTFAQKLNRNQNLLENNILQEDNTQVNRGASQFGLSKTPKQPVYNPFIRFNGYWKNKNKHLKQFYNLNERGYLIPGVKIRGQSMGQKTKSFNLIQNYKQQPSKTVRMRKIYSSSSQRKVQMIPTFSQRQFTQQIHKNEKLIFNEPQRNQKRQVLHKKTIILSANQSCLLELSLLQNRMLIVAYLMGIKNKCIKEMLSAKRTQNIMKEYSNNLEQFCSKISLQKMNNEYQVIKISSNTRPKDEVSNQEQIKQKIRMQKQFLKRNYYNLRQFQPENQSQNKEHVIFSNQKTQEFAQRLVGQRKYLMKARQKQSKIQQNFQSSNRKYNSAQSKINIVVAEHRFEQKNSTPKITLASTFPSQLKEGSLKQEPKKTEQKKIKIPLKRTNSIEFQKQSEASLRKSQIDNFLQQSRTESIKANNLDKVQDKNKQEYAEDQNDVQQMLVFQSPSALLESLKSQTKNVTDQELLSSITTKIKPIQHSTISIKEELKQSDSLL